MKIRYKVMVIIVVLILLTTGCYSVEKNKSETDNLEFTIINNNLRIDKWNKSYLVSSEESDETFKLGKDIGIIFRDDRGNLSIKLDVDGEKGICAMINGIDIAKELIMINGKTYRIHPHDSNATNELDINTLFRGINEDIIVLNPNNYEEFIDGKGKIYAIGQELTQKDVGMFLYPVSLEGEDIYNITFDKETLKVFNFKDKISMLQDGKKANNIKSIDYEGIYQYEYGFVIGMNSKYFKLEEK